jgi:hypothetical protein
VRRKGFLGVAALDSHSADRGAEGEGDGRSFRWAAFYTTAVNKQWDFLNDWYELPRPGTEVDPIGHERRGHPTLPPPLPLDG